MISTTESESALPHQSACSRESSRIDAVLDELRPAMGVDGGGVELLAVKGGRVEVRLKGACLTCPSADLTLKRGIEPAVKSRFRWVSEVVRVP